MPKLLRTVVVFLLFRIDWRKLFIVCSILMVGSILIQISSLPYPLTKWISRPLPVSSFKPVRTSVHLGKTRDAPWVVSFNSSVRLNTNMAISKKESRQRSRRNNVKSIDIVLPHSPPRIVRSRPSRLERYLSLLTPDEALAFIKKDIGNVSRSDDDDDDPELYAPIFRNISTFKRSYRWMERMLKVYIYQEGDKPVFHTPDLNGIYASEGWFMRLIEGNRQFVTKEPEKAHLFYLPYSSRQLQVALYVPNSHDLKPLAVFLRDYVNMLAAKYPFWNRTRGSDHFLVACHDWGPYTVKSHKDLARNTIKALCNADLSEGVFKSGKDVSLPETKIRNPRRPLRNIGGKRVSQRPILAFFAGNRHGRVRNVLIQHWRDKEDDMRIFAALPNRVSRVMSYPEHMKSSKYCICPMGFEVNSPRIVEAIYNECVPVIIADNFVPPLNEVLNWEAFSVIIAEKDIPKLKEILLAIPLRRYIAMQTNVKKLQKHFLWHAKPVRYDLFHMILHSIWSSRLNQIQIPQTS